MAKGSLRQHRQDAERAAQCAEHEAEKAQAYADRVAASEKAHPCKYGHPDCAAWNRGPCVDEVLSDAGL